MGKLIIGVVSCLIMAWACYGFEFFMAKTSVIPPLSLPGHGFAVTSIVLALYDNLSKSDKKQN
jgi:hypothetical protein